MAEFRRSTALPGLEVRRSRQESRCYRPHAHDAFSIGVIDEGSSVLTGSLNGPIRLERGDLVVIPAGQVHACNPDEGAWRYQMIHLDQGWAASLTPGHEASALFSGIGVLRRPGLRHQVGALSELIFADETRERLETGFRDLLRELDATPPAHLVAGNADPELIARLRPVMDRLRGDEVNPSLGELAVLVGMTRYELVRAMKRATGLAPLAWRQNARIIQARRMLCAGQPIAETAQALGFSDQSHLHRVFRAHVAASPGAYRG